MRHGGSDVSSGVGLGSALPTSLSSPSGIPFVSSFPTPPARSSSYLVSAPPGFSFSSFVTPVPLLPPSSSYPGLASSVT